MKNEDCKKLIYELMDRLQSVIYSRNRAFGALRLIFLKYALDNYIGATSKEDMQQCVRAQKMFALRDIDNGIDTIIPVLQYIDKAYGFENILSCTDNIDEYARELFGIDRFRQKKNASEERFRSLMELVGSYDFEERNDQTIGKNLVDAMIDVIGSTFERNSFSGENVTNFSVSTLAKELLRVEQTDDFVDFTSGTGVSTLLITGDAQPSISNVEIQGTSAAASAMLYIMYGYSKIRIAIGDSISNRIPDLQGNKLFVDPPLMSRVEKTDTNRYTDSSLAVLNRVMNDYLTTDGEAIVVLPSSALFQAKKQTVELRKELVERGLIKAVIALPPMWYAASVNTNLLMISKKDAPRSEVLFIDATKDVKGSGNKSRQATVLSTEAIGKICKAVELQEMIPGFSCLTHLEMIQKNDYNLVPTTYISAPADEDTITMEEVNAKLEALYRQLMEK